MDIHTRQLRYFMELAKCLNFTKAAVNLYIAQPALSQQIADLEKQLGVTLFERNSRSVVLTPAGKILQSSCPEILSKLESVKQQVLWAQAGLRGSLKIGYSDMFQHMLPDIVQEFLQQYPDVALEFHNGNVKEVISAVESGEIDLGFTGIDPQAMPQNNPPSYNILWRDDLCIAVRKDHPFVVSRCTDYSLLEEDTFILADEVTIPGFWANVQRICGEIGLVIKRQTISKHYKSIMIQVGAGMGYSILPSIFQSCVSAPTDNVIFIPIKKNCAEFGVIWYDTSSNAALPLFLDLLEKTVDTVPEK